MNNLSRVKSYDAARAELTALEASMRKGNKSYDSLITRLKTSKNKRSIDKTMVWIWNTDIFEKEGDYEIVWFNATPPVSEAYSDNRLLLVGTKCEVGDIYYGLEKFGELIEQFSKREVRKEIVDTAKRARISIEEKVNEIGIEMNDLKYTYCATTGIFWEKFFDQERFLDNPKITVPRAIIATGLIRNYCEGAGSTIDVTDRLKNIADAWNIPIRFISSWAS